MWRIVHLEQDGVISTYVRPAIVPPVDVCLKEGSAQGESWDELHGHRYKTASIAVHQVLSSLDANPLFISPIGRGICIDNSSDRTIAADPLYPAGPFMGPRMSLEPSGPGMMMMAVCTCSKRLR